MLGFTSLGRTTGPSIPLVINPVTDLAGTATFPPAEVQLSWTPPVEGSATVANLIVYRDDVAIATVAGTATGYLDDDAALLPDVAYSYKVETVDAGGATIMSPSINVAMPTLVLLDPVENFSAVVPVETLDCNMTWDTVVQGSATFDLDHYDILVDNVVVTTAGPTATSLSIELPDVDTTYSISIVAVDTAGNGNSGTSPVVEVETVAEFPYVATMTMEVFGRLTSFTRAGDFSIDSLVYNTDFSWVEDDNMQWSEAQRDGFYDGTTAVTDLVNRNDRGFSTISFPAKSRYAITSMTISGRADVLSTRIGFKYFDQYDNLLFSKPVTEVGDVETVDVGIDLPQP